MVLRRVSFFAGLAGLCVLGISAYAFLSPDSRENSASTIASIAVGKAEKTIESLIGEAIGADTMTTGSIAAAAPRPALTTAKGRVSGLPVPRFVSLKKAKTFVRRGPSTEQPVSWTFNREGWPVEIIAEFEQWRRIRDIDGQEGWIKQTMLTGTRMVAIAPSSKEETVSLRRDPAADARPVAMLASGVLAEAKLCDGEWCRIEGARFDGYVRQSELWGVYPGEDVED